MTGRVWFMILYFGGLFFGSTGEIITAPGKIRNLVPGSNDFRYHGGRLMVDPITVHLVWVGRWTEHSKQAIRNAILSLSSEQHGPSADFPSLSNWWTIATQYNDSNNRSVSSNVVLSNDECSVEAQSANISEIERLVVETCSSTPSAGLSDVYHVLISQEPRQNIQKCSGRLSNQIYSWVREPQSDEYCNLWRRFGNYLQPPNGDISLDSVISSVLAQTADIATNLNGNGWKDDGGNTVSSKCPSPTGWEGSNGPVIEEGGVSWNVFGINGSRYIVQQLWSQEGMNCALQVIESCRGLLQLHNSTGLISEGLIMNHKVGLQPYKPNLFCQWIINVHHATFIRLRLNYLSVAASDTLRVSSCSYDSILISIIFGTSEDIIRSCKLVRDINGFSSQTSFPEIVGSEVLVGFHTHSTQTNQAFGWEMEYKAGYCGGDYSLYTRSTRSGSVSDGSPEGVKYLSQLDCKWLLRAKGGTKVHLNFTRFDTVEGQDVLVVYKGMAAQKKFILDVFSGSYAVLPRRTYTGPVLLAFSTKTEDGYGWAADFEIEHPDFNDDRRDGSKAEAIAATIGAFLGMLSLVLGLKLLCSRMSKGSFNQATKQFSKAELDAATDNFCKENMIAPDVFKGVLATNERVVVQRSMESCSNQYQVLSRIKHPHVVAVLGFCYQTEENFLVFKNTSIGTLAAYLFCDINCLELCWERRLKLASQVSRALGYLHTYAEPSVVHQSLCSKNVLLDSSWNARLAGFGSALSIIGAASPEERKLKAHDVYRMGIVIIELLTGLRAWNEVDNQPSACVTWASHFIRMGIGLVILDRRLVKYCESDRRTRALLKMAEIGAWCLNEKAEERPNIMEVVTALAQIEGIYLGTSEKRKHRMTEKDS